MQFPVNDICNSKCQMCNIWQQKLDRQVTPEEARRLFSDPLFSSVRAVGMNGGEPTLRADLPDLADALFDSMPALRYISLITNGLRPDVAIERIDAVADRVMSHGGTLDVMVSLDGVGALHDRVRGVPGNFDDAVRVLDHLLEKRDRVKVRVGCTVIHDNVHGLHELLDFCIRRDVYIKFRLGVPHRRLYNVTPVPKTIGKRTWLDTQPFHLTEKQRWHFAQFLHGLIRSYEPSLQQRYFYESLSNQVLHGSARRAGCDWQHRGVTITSRGELMFCAVQSDVLGDVSAGGAERLYYGSRNHLDDIIKTKCAGCAHDYVGPPGGAQQWKLLADALMIESGITLPRIRNMPLFPVVMRARNLLRTRAFVRERHQLARVSPRRAQPALSPNGAILICGWYGTETLGDKAILASIVENIRRMTEQRPIKIISLQPPVTRLTLAEIPEIGNAEVISTTDALRDIGSSSAIIFGGGPLMAVRELAEMEALFLRAKTLRIPRVIAGCGVGPVGGRAYRAAIRSILSAASSRIFRDRQSLQAAASLGVDVAHDHVAEDPAFGWVSGYRSANLVASAGRPPTVALGLRDWPYLQYAPGMSVKKAVSIKEALETAVISALERLLTEIPNLRILPIPFCTHDSGGDDRLVYWKMSRRSTKLREALDTSTIGCDLGASEYIRRMGTVDACLAMRFHSIVFSLALGKPPVVLDYTLGQGKSHYLSQRYKLPTFPVDRVDADALATHLLAAMNSDFQSTSRDELQFDNAFASAWRSCFGHGTGL